MTLGPYTLVKNLGEGSFGKVTHVRDAIGRDFALKELRPKQQILEHIDLSNLKKRFAREVKYQSSINHPNVVRIFDSNLEADPPYFVMELAECTLASELDADRTLGGAPSRPLYDILTGLDALHEKGFVHRDLKPQNVLKLKNKDSTYRYALSDFGLLSIGDAATTTLTATAVKGGTERYAAPELIEDFKRATVRADIYSFGAILHDIFDGRSRVPYTELTASGDIGPIIKKCTKRNAIRRYPSIPELRNSLYEVLSSASLAFVSDSVQDVINILNARTALSDEEWDNLIEALDSSDSTGANRFQIFRALQIDHFKAASMEQPEIFAALSRDFCDFIADSGFDFDYCDILADKAQAIFDVGNVEQKAYVLIGLMVLGVYQNRWVVERRFMNLASSAPESLIDRFVVEMEVQELKFNIFITHIEKSIGESRSRLPARLLAAI